MSDHDVHPSGPDRDLYDAWRAERGAGTVPEGFPERVLAALPEGVPAAPVEQLPWLSRPALRAAAILLAVALGLLRLSSVLSLLTV
jgi:hypothetical protein